MTHEQLAEIRERWSIQVIPPELQKTDEELAASGYVVSRLIDAAQTIPLLLAEVERLGKEVEHLETTLRYERAIGDDE
jgi:hypothetical protein